MKDIEVDDGENKTQTLGDALLLPAESKVVKELTPKEQRIRLAK